MSDDPDTRKHFFDDPRNVKRVLRSLFAACAIVALLDVADLVSRMMGGHGLRHAERAWEGLPGFYAVYGFVGCVFLVLVAKQMRKVVMRDEDYYDR